MKKSASILFNPRPESWGLRGDPYLWDELGQAFADVPIPISKACFRDHFEKVFQKLTKHSFEGNRENEIFVEKYAHGGMSSGHISIEFWKNVGLPLLLSRLETEMGN